MTTRKTILNDKGQIIDGNHILATYEIITGLTNAEERRKKSKILGVNKGKKRPRWTSKEACGGSESSQDESVAVLDCIEVEYKIINFEVPSSGGCRDRPDPT